MSLTNRILVAMAAGIVLGSGIELLLGSLSPESRVAGVINDYLIFGLFDVLGRIFIASLKLLVVPLVMVSLICGMTSLGSSARMGAIAGRTIGLYLLTTCVAVSLGLLGATLLGPGNGLSIEAASAYQAKTPPPLTDVLVNIFPSNPFSAMAKGEMLQVIVFALLVGFALTRAGEAGQRIASWFRDMEVVVMKMVGVMIELAPWGVFALLVKLFATMGFSTIANLAAYFLTLSGLLIFHGIVVYSLLLKTTTGLNPGLLRAKMRRVWAFAFSTASSGATLPITLRTVETRLGVPKSVAGFAVPLGATINMDGTALYVGIVSVFAAQAFGIDLTLTDYLIMAGTTTLVSVGTAAVPSASLFLMAAVMETIGMTAQQIAVTVGFIFIIDRPLDMLRTSINIAGDLAVSTAVATWEGEFDREVFDRPLNS